MGINLTEAMGRFLPLTEGPKGKPQYRTNPQTGQRYTFAELTQKAYATQSQYQINNPYIAPDKEGIMA